jgi:hypothetical protein
MKKYEHDLLTSMNTEVFFHEDESVEKYHAPHTFEVESTNPDRTDAVGLVHFQEGPVKEVGLNGVFNEDLIAMVICRLEHFQRSEWSCRENAVAITKLEEALMWLRKRTVGREKRGVLGTSQK